MPILSYYDQRHGDTYVVTIDSEGEFICAKRYLVGVGRDPIVYDSLADVPIAHKANIEQKISEFLWQSQ